MCNMLVKLAIIPPSYPHPILLKKNSPSLSFLLLLYDALSSTRATIMGMSVELFIQSKQSKYFKIKIPKAYFC